MKILSTKVYSLPRTPSSLLTYTDIVEVSIYELSKINLWSKDESTLNAFCKNVPCNTSTLKEAVPEASTVVCTLSGVANVYEVSLTLPVHTRPLLRTTELYCEELISLISNDIVAFAAVLERGTYPMFLAKETTFSRRVAESKKDSFTIMFELKAVI